MTISKIAKFLREYEKLCRKHGVYISGCGCCGSPYLCSMTPPYYPYNVEHKECEVLRLIQEKKMVEEKLKAVLDCRLCACNGCDDEDCQMVKSEVEE